MAFRFKHAGVKMQAAEEDFEAGGRKFRAGAFIIASADRAALDPTMKELGIAGFGVAAAPTVAMHDLDVPRIGYVHSWSNTQNEGWVRAALDTYGVPYTYFGDIKLREGNLRQKYDVIIFPHVGGNAQSQVNGIPKTGTLPLPYKKTTETPNLGVQDQADDIRGGMGWEGLMELVKFVREGGTLITEGATSTIFPDYNITSGVTVESPDDLFVRGSVMRGVVSDRRSPIAYGYDAQVPVYFSQNPVLNAAAAVSAAVGGGRGGDGLPGVGMNTQPMATRRAAAAVDVGLRRTRRHRRRRPPVAAVAVRVVMRRRVRWSRRSRWRPWRVRRRGCARASPARRSFRSRPIRTTCCCRACSSAGSRSPAARKSSTRRSVRATSSCSRFGRTGAGRPRARSSSGFNAILNWNDLDAGRPGARRPATAQ